MSSDPAVPDWAARELPATWPDDLSLSRFREIWRILWRALRKTQGSVTLPRALPGADRIPRYALQEFHGLPNGNYSRRITHGYSTGFDRLMLGVMKDRRDALARELKGCRAVLDLGCGAGHGTGALIEGGISEVWGLDLSPYMLQHAARTYPAARFVQGAAEDTAFQDARFDGLCASFLFHELPPRISAAALRECHRILRPGGRLAIVEPGREHWQTSGRRLFQRYGWHGPYFRALATRTYEPFLASFHALDFGSLLEQSGFVEIRTREEFPTALWTAVRGT